MTDIRFGILTVSDRSASGERPDGTAPALSSMLAGHGFTVARQDVVPDDVDRIRGCLIEWSADAGLDIILTAGGTGFSPRDVTPEATRAVIEKYAPGLDEGMRAASREKTPHALLSRGVSGMRGHVLIINLPGSPRAAVENLQAVLPVLQHAVELLRSDPGAEAHHRPAG